MYYKALVHTLVQRPYKVRRQAQLSVRKILSTLGGSSVALHLLEQFRIMLKDQQVRRPSGATFYFVIKLFLQ